MNKTILTVKEIAERWGLEEQTVRKMGLRRTDCKEDDKYRTAPKNKEIYNYGSCEFPRSP